MSLKQYLFSDFSFALHLLKLMRTKHGIYNNQFDFNGFALQMPRVVQS